MSFTDHTVLVTGGTSGIGRATAERFARQGATVLLSGRDTGRGENVVTAIEQAGGTARFIQADLSRTDDVLHLAAEATDVDILINNAGGSVFAPTADLTPEQIHDSFAVNVIAPLLLVGKIAPAMVERGHGNIISISSHAAGHGIPFLPAYGAAKAGIDVLTKTWAIELGPAGIRVNAVSPGSVRTPPSEVMGEMFDEIANASPLGRAATADEIASVVTFLASDDASYMTGAIVPVDAGLGAA